MNKQNLGVGCLELNSQARKNVNMVLRSERLSYGPFLKKFEKNSLYFLTPEIFLRKIFVPAIKLILA